jgi:putative Holliday junction resolvase
MRILGIDFGDRQCGLALSDTLFLTAQPLGVHRQVSPAEDEKYFRGLVAQRDIGEVVVGLPLKMDGHPGSRAQKTQEFARWLEKILQIRVILWDERLTTHQAQQILQEQKVGIKKRKAVEDQISATLILSSYLESRRREPHAPQDH